MSDADVRYTIEDVRKAFKDGHYAGYACAHHPNTPDPVEHATQLADEYRPTPRPSAVTDADVGKLYRTADEQDGLHRDEGLANHRL